MYLEPWGEIEDSIQNQHHKRSFQLGTVACQKEQYHASDATLNSIGQQCVIFVFMITPEHLKE